MDGGDGNETVSTEPWKPVQPFIETALTDARARYDAAKAHPNFPEWSQVAPFNPIQKEGQVRALDYADTDLSSMIAGVGESYQNLLNPGANQTYQATMAQQGPYHQYLADVMGRGLPDVENIARGIAGSVDSGVSQGNMYGSVGQFSDPIVRALNFDTPPVVALDTPEIEFNRGVAENETLTDTLKQMMSGQVNMDIWQPLMDQMSRSMTRDFTEQVMPHVRSQAMSAGAYGQSMGMRGQGLAADRFSENLSDSMERIIAQGGIQALQQQQAGAGLAAQMYGQDLDAELRRSLAQGQLGMDTLRLREAQRASLAGEDIQRTQLGLNRDLGLSELNLRRDAARENAAIDRSRLGFEADRWQDELNRDMTLAGLQTGLDKYRTDIGAGLEAGGILSNEVKNLYTQGLNAQMNAVGQSGNIAQLGLMPSQIYEAVGNQKYARQQALLDEDAKRWWAEHPTMGTEAANQMWYQNAIQPYVGAGGSTTTPYEGGSPLVGGLGGAATMGGLLSGLATSNIWNPGGWTAAALIGTGALAGGFGAKE